MADRFDIEAKLKITGVEVKGDLDAGTLKFKVDTSALKKLVSDAGEAAKKVKAKFDNIKLNKIRVEVNKNSLRSVESQIRNAVQNAVKKTKLELQTSVAGGTKTDPFKAQRQAAGKSAQSLQTLHNLTKQLNGGLRSLIRTMGSMKSGPAAAAAPKGNLPFPSSARTVDVGSLSSGGGRIPPTARGGAGAGGFSGGGGIRDAANGLKDITDNSKKATQSMKSLEEVTFEVGRKAAVFRGVAIAINTIVDAAQAAVKFIIDFNDSLIEVNKILQLTDRSLAVLGDELFELSARTGVATDETISIAEAFARAGLTGRGYGTVVDLTSRALTGLQGTTLDATQASELFIQIIQQVESGARGLNKELITTTQLFDVLGKAEDITASKATDVQQAFKRSAASIFATGASIQEATGIISVLQERTQRGGDVIGTALKTLASRISSSTSDATKALNSIGVATIDAEGNLRNLFDVLRDTAIKFQDLTESERADIAVKAAGIRQVEVFRAALLDFGRTQDVTNQLIQSSGDASRKQAAEQTKLANVISRLQIGFQKLIKTASEGIIGEAFVFAIRQTEKLVTGIANIDKTLGGALSTFTAFAAIGLSLKVLLPMLSGMWKTLKFFVGVGKEAAMSMEGIKQKAQQTAATVEGRVNTSIERTAALTTRATGAMSALTAATNGAAAQAERLAAASNARMGGLGGGFIGPVQPGNQGPMGGAIIAQGIAGRGFKQVGRLGKIAQGTGKAFQFVGKNILGFGAIASIAGSALQSFSDDLRKQGKTGLGGAADIGGGALSGAGTGALIGSFIAPGIGTAIGGAVGAVAGAVPGLVRTFGDAKDEIDSLRDRYIKLGIVQAENGEITSAVAAKLDKALRNLEAFQNFELNLDEQAMKDLFDPEGASKRAKAITEAREDAFKGLQVSFKRSAGATDKNNKVLTALSKALQARTGGDAIDLADPQLLQKSAPALAAVGETTLAEIENEAVRLAKRLGVATDEVEQIFQDEVNKVKSKPLTLQAVRAAEQAVMESTTAFVNGLNVLIPAGEQLSKAAREQTAKFKEAVESIALGQGGEEAQKIVKETLGKALSGQVLIRGQGDENLIGRGGRNALQAIVDQAQGIAAQRRNVGTVGLGNALPDILKKLAPLLAGGAETTQIQRIQERLIRSQEHVVSAFTTFQFPVDTIGLAIDKPVGELELILRKFASDFGREINKLTDAQLRAVTPQEQLAQALADNAMETAKAAQARAELEKADVVQQARQEFSKIAAPGELQFGGVPGRENDKSTVGDALTKLFNALLDANRRIARENIVDPRQQRAIIAEAQSGVDLTGANNEQIAAITKSVNEVSKSFVKLDTEALQAITKSNSAALNALKKRMSEEERLLGLDKRRREVVALNARAIAEELTGIRRIVAERNLESKLADENIAAQRGRLGGMQEEIDKLRAVELTELNRVGVLNQIDELERKHATESIQLEDMVAKRRMQAIREVFVVANEAVNRAKAVSAEENKRVSLLSDISSLLSVDVKDMQKFNNELDTLGKQFKLSQAELASEAATVNATVTNQAEKEARLADIKRRGTILALEQAKAEAQVIQKRREAIKQVSEELIGNQQEQAEAQRAIIDATRGVSDAFTSYLEAVDGAIMATTRYNLGLAMASVETTKITGGFSGLREQLGSVQDAFRDAEQLARNLGASEKTLVEIRRESINQQLQLFQNLLQEQSQLARNFFTSSTSDQADLFLGIQETKGIAELLGGSFSEFKKKGEGAINDLGAQILSLPQETRQRIMSALDTLGGVGGTVGGFTADELKTAIETAALGVSGEGLQVDPLFEVQERIAALQEQQAQLATEQLIASQEQVMNAKQQLEEAQAQKDLAEIQLERIKQEGEKLRTKLGELRGQLNTTLLRQEQTQRQGFVSVTSAVARAAGEMVTKLPDAFSVKVAEAFRSVMQEGGIRVPTAPGGGTPTPPTKGSRMANNFRNANKNRAELQQQFAQSGLSSANQTAAATSAPVGSAGTTFGESTVDTSRRLDDILTELKELNSTSESNLAVTEAIRDSNGNTVGTAAATLGGTAEQPEININVNGTTTVTVSGFEAGVARLATTLSETLGGFVSDDEARRIANEVVENIRTELLRRGILTPTTL